MPCGTAHGGLAPPPEFTCFSRPPVTSWRPGAKAQPPGPGDRGVAGPPPTGSYSEQRRASPAPSTARISTAAHTPPRRSARRGRCHRPGGQRGWGGLGPPSDGLCRPRPPARSHGPCFPQVRVPGGGDTRDGPALRSGCAETRGRHSTRREAWSGLELAPPAPPTPGAHARSGSRPLKNHQTETLPPRAVSEGGNVINVREPSEHVVTWLCFPVVRMLAIKLYQQQHLQTSSSACLKGERPRPFSMLHLKSVFRFCGFSAQLIAPFCRVLKPPTGRAKT